MKKISLLILIIFLCCSLLSCDVKENLLESSKEVAKRSIFDFTDSLERSESFTYFEESKSIYKDSLEDGTILYTNHMKKILQYNSETQVFAYYYKYYETQYDYNYEVLGFIQYDSNLESYIKTNSYTKTYELKDFKNLDDVFKYFFNHNYQQLNHYYFERFNDKLEDLTDPMVLKSDVNTHFKLTCDSLDDTYNYELIIEDYYLSYKGESLKYYQTDQRYCLVNNEYLLIIDNNDLTPLDLTGYTLHPVG